jgi:hypothetical protein
MNTFSTNAPRLASLALSSALVLAAIGAIQQAQAAQVAVQVSVHEPGFHGRIVIGDQPPPVIYQQPVIVQQTPVAVVQQPIYMSVPPAHYRHWAAHCGYWRACGQPVYFVQPGQVYQNAQRAWVRQGWRHEEREERREERWDERRQDRREWRGEHDHHGHHGRD